MNVEIARAIGEIMSSRLRASFCKERSQLTTSALYSSTTISQTKLVKSIQSTLQKLYETQRSIPNQFAIDFDKPRLAMTRTSATLYLSLFQAILLLVRPMLLQRVKDKIKSIKANLPPPSRSTAMARLCHSSRDAARKSIRILTALQEDENKGKTSPHRNENSYSRPATDKANSSVWML